jgi:hypothetical protein
MTSNDLEWLTRWTALMIFLIRLLAAHALLAATQNGADANRGNPLLTLSRPAGLHRARSQSRLQSRSIAAREPARGAWQQVWISHDLARSRTISHDLARSRTIFDGL